MIPMPSRFVILVHSGHGPTHYDLMVEHGPALATWQLETDPAAAENADLPARRLADHRPAYLDYEGPIRGGRGHVRQADSGRCRLLAAESELK